MNKLKRGLCLLLCCAMLIGMTVTAAGAFEFTDADEIVNTEAVETMAELGIINGKEDGSCFDPTGDVTRAELCKMIYMALNGGVEPEFAYESYSFSDLGDSWAAGYIEYCCGLGIVSGRGDGTFDPNAAVTGAEAAKMLLVALGYDAEVEGFTGAGWAEAVIARAGEKELLSGLDDLDTSASLIRDSAALMVYNTLNAVTVEYDYTETTVDGEVRTTAAVRDNEDGGTLLSEKFGIEATGGSQAASSTSGGTSGGGGGGGSSGGSSSATYTVGTPAISSVTGSAATAGTYSADKFSVTADKTTASDNEVVTFTVTYTGSVADSSDTFTFTPSAASGADTYVAASADLTGINNGKTWTCSLSVNAANVVSPVIAVTAATVNTACGYMTEVSYDDTAGEYTYGLADAIYGGGSVTGESGDTIPAYTTTADYTALYGTYVCAYYDVDSASNVTITDIKSAGGEAVAAVFGNLVLSSYSNCIATIDSVSYGANGAYSSVAVYYFENGGLTPAFDGNLEEVFDSNSDQFDVTAQIVLVSGSDGDELIDYMIVIPASVSEVTAVSADTVTAGGVSYSFADDVIESGVDAGDYVRIVMDENSFDDMAHITGANVISGVVVGTKTRSGRAAAMIDGTWYWEGVVTGSMLDLTDAYKLCVVNGYYYGATKGDLGFGYLTGAPYTTAVDGTACSAYEIWTGSESITVYDIDCNTAGAEQYDMISYYSADYLGHGEDCIVNVKVVGTQVAVTGYDATGGNITVLDADSIQTAGTIGGGTAVWYIDSTVPAGAAGGTVSVADTLGTGEYILNAYYYDETGDGTPELVVYDVNNDLANLDNTAGTGATAYAAAAYAVAKPGIVSADGYSASADQRSALAGDTVTVTVTATAAADSGTISVAAAGAASVSPAYQTHTAGSEGTYYFYITMGSAAVTSITVSVTTSSETSYGYVVSMPYLTVVDGNYYTCFNVWTGSDTVTVYDADQDYPAVRTPISYAVMSGRYIYDVASVGTAVAVTGYDGDNITAMDAAGNTIYGQIDDDDTVILYVSSTTPAGVEGGDLAVAGTTAGGAYILNAYYYDSDSNGTPELIVYDVNNDLYNLSNTAGIGTTP